jgi:hypothetical protein
MKRFLFPGIEGEEEIIIVDDDPAPDGGEGETPDDGGETPDDGGETPDDDAGGDPEPKPQSKAQKEIIKLRERAQKAEEDIRKAKEEIESFKAASTKPRVDKLWEEEEEALKNPALQPWQKYTIETARASRRTEQMAIEMQRKSDDLQDKMTFDQLKAEKPKMYAAYSSEVEKRYQEFFKKGTIVPRLIIFDNLLGEALRTGKLKTKTAPPVKRGETPGARSDAPRPASAGRNSPEAVAKRLENIPI